MERLLDALRMITPGFVKTTYHRSRLALRTVFRDFIEMPVRGVVIKVGVSSVMEQYRAESYSTKEPETLDWLDRNVTSHDVLFDIGANVGLYSLYAAKACPTCKIYAFEPESQNFASLCRNIVLNGMTNIIPCNVPISDRETFDLLYVSAMQPGSALHSFGQASAYGTGPDAVVVRQGALSVTLDALVGKYALPQPTLLKVDVDGIEEKILDGAGMVLKSDTLRTILVEVNFKDASEVTWAERKLASFGYRLLKKSDWVAELNGMKSQNYIFGRP